MSEERVLYNEIDKNAAQWLRELIKKGLIAEGIVDERSIEDLTPEYCNQFTQCHFFAGIGVWSHALRQAGWSDDKPVWTGSCPCQPFSPAGQGKGFADERHLWPSFHWLIKQCQPVCVFGEQVAQKAGLTWFDTVSNDLENEGYTVGAAVTAACMFGAPHQRKRLYFVGKLADTASKGLEGSTGSSLQGPEEHEELGRPSGSKAGSMANSNSQRHNGVNTLLREGAGRERGAQEVLETSRSSEAISMANSISTGSQGRIPRGQDKKREAEHGHIGCDSTVSRTNPTNGFWANPDWIGCRDNKFRPIESGTFPLVDGSPARVGRLRGYGNAIVAPQAQAISESYIEGVNF